MASWYPRVPSRVRNRTLTVSHPLSASTLTGQYGATYSTRRARQSKAPPMNADASPSLAELINRQLGRAPDTPLPRGIKVRPEVLWFWLAVEMAPATLPRVTEAQIAAE